MANDIQVTIEEVQVDANIVEQNVNVELLDQEIANQIVEQNVQADIVEEEVQICIEGAIVNYTGSPLVDKHETFVLSAGDILNKYINLAQTPIGNVYLEIESANTQIEDRSWIVSGSSISWNGYDIENLLEEGDVLSIKYKYQ